VKSINITTSASLMISGLFHLMVFLMIGTVVIFEGQIPQRFFSGEVNAPLIMDSEIDEVPAIIEEEMPQIADEVAQVAEMSGPADSETAVEVIVAQTPTSIPSFTAALITGNSTGPITSMTKNFGNGTSGNGTGGSGTGVLTRFGSRGGSGRGSLKGAFYDFKLDSKGDPVKGAPKTASIINTMSDNPPWKIPDDLDPYSPQVELFLKTVLFEGTQDIEAGKAFEAPDTRPGQWLAHYYGDVKALKSGKFRLGGWGDNYLGIALNGEVILDACDTSQISAATEKTAISNHYDIPGKGGCNTFQGQVFELVEGKTYRIDIIMGDRGGIFTAGAWVMDHKESFDPAKVFVKYPMLVFGDLSHEEREFYPFVSDRSLRPTIFKAL
jgi:hypothetical protein